MKTSREAARIEKLPVTLDLNLTFMQTPAVKRVKLIITKGTNGNLAITHYQSNEPIIVICAIVKISTNPSLRVRSRSLRLHESEIQVQSNQRFFFSRRLATRLRRFEAISRRS